MIDIHSHILPGVDDGSESPEMSRTILETMHAQGVETVVATPHFYAHKDTPARFLERRSKAVARMEYDPGCAPNILLGAEVAYFDGMSRTGELEQLQLGDSGLLLVEMPFGPWSQRMIRELCQLPLQLGLVPVLAHVERYRRRDQLPKFIKQLMGQEIYFQCNAEAFLSVRDRRWALNMLKGGAVHFLGTDTHNLTTRAPKLDQAVALISQKLGQDVPEELWDMAKELLKL